MKECLLLNCTKNGEPTTEVIYIVMPFVYSKKDKWKHIIVNYVFGSLFLPSIYSKSQKCSGCKAHTMKIYI
jgi:hypothetical protein